MVTLVSIGSFGINISSIIMAISVVLVTGL